MKKYLILFAVAFGLTACYDDYVKDYDDPAIYFPYQTDVRSVVVGEGMQFSTGVNLAGIISNDENRVVDLSVDNTLIDATTFNAFKNHSFGYVKALFSTMTQIDELPGSEYSLLVDGVEATKTVIKKGSHMGKVTIKVDSMVFLSDATRTSPRYVVPLRITAVSSLKIYEPKATAVIGVRYENMLFGHYWHGGETVVKDTGGQEIETIKYHTTVPQMDNKVWTLKTVGPMELVTNAVGGEMNSSKSQIRITQGVDGAITVSSVAGATYQVEADGECVFNRAKLLQDRKIALKYKYTKDGNIYHAKDTLTFRNRIRDGVNEWQDENPNK